MYLFYFLFSLALALLLTPAVKRLAWTMGCVDFPKPPRKLHGKPTPLLGGFVILLSFLTVLAIYLFFGDVNYHIIPLHFFRGIIFGAIILLIGGLLDDKYNLSPKLTWITPALASLIIVVSGIGVGITFITNPFGGHISLNFMVLGIKASAIFVWLWMMGMIFTTKFLDGLDGLATGVGAIASLTLFCLSLTSKINQPMTATMAIIFCGALVGYLIYAFHPASIFLGESGSTLIGFILGVLSIILGGKIATALLVMGVPVLDVAWVICYRLWKRASPFRGDRQHLHFRLLDNGFSQRQTVLILYCVAAIFGFTAIFLQSFGKFIALLLLGLVMLSLAALSFTAYKRNQNS